MRKYKIWTLLIVLSLLAACKQPQSLTPSVSEVAQIKANGTSIRLFCLTNKNGMTIKVTNFARLANVRFRTRQKGELRTSSTGLR